MMTNKEIAQAFRELGSLLELHGDNPFKVRPYQNAYRAIRALEHPLSGMQEEEIAGIKGIGKAILGKIGELLEKGQMATLERYRAQTPEGVREMLHIKGFGPKKIRVVWQELGVESLGELMYAVNENRLLELKGFGPKTQEDLRQKLEYYLRSRDLFHYAALESDALELERRLRELLPGTPVALTGAVRRAANTLDGIDLLVGLPAVTDDPLRKIGLTDLQQEKTHWSGKTSDSIPVRIRLCEPASFGETHLISTGTEAFVEALMARISDSRERAWDDEAAIFSAAGLPPVPPEMRENEWALDALDRGADFSDLIRDEDIRGVVHAHSTYSDGLHSLREMALAARDAGYEYLVITDHSRSAFYANGLKAERVLEQFEEIDRINRELAPFRIFKGIESDILADGSLDYEDELLARFEVVIASVHSNLRMDETKATERILKAVANPYTTMLGHPTGRLLLSREGYPLDHGAVIEACARHGVAIELNANPYRLDLDWSWLPAAREAGVPISINPDAHSQAGLHDIHYGVRSARKGGLRRSHCLNALGLAGFEAFLEKRKKRLL